MSDTRRTLYDDDILLWSEQQAEAIRLLGRRRDLPNAFDAENVAEEIESVGRSELAAVKSQIRLICLHLMKLATDPDSDASRHWRGEVVAFHAELIGRYAPSMRQRIDFAALWASALEQRAQEQGEASLPGTASLPARPPFALDDLLADRIDSGRLVEQVRGAAAA
jgi:hypothetical protein